nr:immunoglobulin heavy chain junction region [Macaca mulatta]
CARYYSGSYFYDYW